MSIAHTYPVFEADQVLTNNHLNSLFDYIDQQNRLTRIKLIGSGIVCGLDINPSQTSINVTKGCALTSQGFLVTLCNSIYTHFISYTAPSLPEHLQFIRQCEDKNQNTSEYYKLFFSQEVFQLVQTENLDDFTGDEQPVSLNQMPGDFLSKYVVVLFLEAEELNLKNCDTNDCNDKGSQMDFQVKALLVGKEVIDRINKRNGTGTVAKDSTIFPALKRYNVPAQRLSSASDVLNAFNNLTDKNTLTSIAEALKECARRYQFLLANEDVTVFDTAFEDLSELKARILKTSPILIQYFYDLLDDLIKAYNEFNDRARYVNSVCCMDEMLFPLHIMLGEANVDTSNTRSTYRQYFIFSPLFDSQHDSLGEVRSLFIRLKLLIAEFSLENMLGFERKDIRLTPSRYGKARLSDRCIPYYYNVDGESELLRHWSFSKTRRGEQNRNLSYNASTYANAFPITNPLLFDIEQNNFFRVEGHIGKHISSALTEIKTEQQQNNLPFEVVALSADYIGTLVRGEEPQCVIQDLESDYRVLIAEFVCRLHDGLCIASGTKYTQGASLGSIVGTLGNIFTNSLSLASATSSVATAGLATEAARIVLQPGAASAAEVAKIADEDKLILHSMSTISAAADHIYVSQLVNEFHLSKGYQRGTTLLRLCNPPKGTLGNVYIENVRKNNGTFKNPVLVRGTVPVSPFHFELFEFIDRVEAAIAVLMSAELAELSTEQFKTTYRRLETHVANLRKSSAVIKNEVAMTFDSCIIERLEALKNEYLRRTAQYRLAKNFSYYFSKHGGVEHKAGVPKGGTLLLVYHEERKRQLFDVRSVLVNKEIGSILLKQFPALLKLSDDKDELESKTKDLQLATQFREPELFLRANEVLGKYLDECNDIPAARKEALRAIIKLPPQAAPTFKINDGTVIADFYIPYLCCSDCPPIAYILPTPPAGPTLSLDRTKFCANDKTAFEIRVSPSGGKMTIDDKEIDSDQGVFFLTPAAFKAGTHTIAYTINGIKTTLTFEVIAPPKVSFKAREPQDAYTSDTTVPITMNSSAGADATYKYEFGDGAVITNKEKAVTHIYSGNFDGDSKEVIIKVTVTDGPCSVKVEKTVKISKLIIL
ncbi:MAG: PKD domain-containing protein [Chitinophagaceae bacterium]|nr:PKD domain-containing protein [Chitinophagaceae bacterium]